MSTVGGSHGNAVLAYMKNRSRKMAPKMRTKNISLQRVRFAALMGCLWALLRRPRCAEDPSKIWKTNSIKKSMTKTFGMTEIKNMMRARCAPGE